MVRSSIIAGFAVILSVSALGISVLHMRLEPQYIFFAFQSKSLLVNRSSRPGLRPEAPLHPPDRLRRRGEAAQTPSRDATGNSMKDALVRWDQRATGCEIGAIGCTNLTWRFVKTLRTKFCNQLRFKQEALLLALPKLGRRSRTSTLTATGTTCARRWSRHAGWRSKGDNAIILYPHKSCIKSSWTAPNTMLTEQLNSKIEFKARVSYSVLEAMEIW